MNIWEVYEKKNLNGYHFGIPKWLLNGVFCNKREEEETKNG